AEIQPSFFEITVVMAFDYFVQHEIDIAIVEVGLGGRLDSTNVITPLLSVITNISFDHTNMLGDTIPEIAFEKAGIIKPHIPVVIGEYQAESFPVFMKKANSVSAPEYVAEQNVSLDVVEKDMHHLIVNASYLDQLIYPHLEAGLTADYQLKNMKTVIQAIEILRQKKIEISDEAVYDGLKHVKRNTGITGRLQILSENPLIVADCAHNEGGLQALFSEIKNYTYKSLHIVTGIVQDKDPHRNLKEYPENAVYYFCKPEIPRGLDQEKLQELAATYRLRGKSYRSVKDGLQSAKITAEKDDLILICGSIFVVAEALEMFN
ncbi:MAG: bifunctional folylpolyglutamate synthase/dihydrofolate synthase, partial [Chitinophagales bacterium]|nr:bifunctional folylpolyglutamate synthase/dihydrofolate synthase [Chitinophagales bacterium]